MIPVWTYIVYLIISLAVTIWVAQTLHRNGRVFLIEAFAGNRTLADSVNHLLVVGFYLINTGYVALALRITEPPQTIQTAFESLSAKIGFVLVVLGVMHFFNLVVFSRMRHRALQRAVAAPQPKNAGPHESTSIVANGT